MKMTAPMEAGLCVRDVRALTAFYVDVLGFTDVGAIEVPAARAAPTGLTTGAYTVVRLQTPWGERLKLLQPAHAPAARPGDVRILDRAGTAYLTFIVDDLAGMLTRLRAARVPLVSGAAPVEVRPGVFLVFARDPEGNVLEFVQYADIAAYRPDLAGGARGD